MLQGETLKTCRTEEQIEAAFDALQRELDQTITDQMQQARQQLLEHFDADVHQRLRVQGDDARLALDRVGERFWRLARWGLTDRASFDDDRLQLRLSEPQSDAIPVGAHRLISAVKAEPDGADIDAHLLRLSSPLGQWLLKAATQQPLPPATIRLDYTDHPRRISMLEPLVGTAGWLRLEKLTVDSDAREEHVLATAVTDAGQSLDQERAQRLLEVTGHSGSPAEIPAETETRLSADAEQLARATVARATAAGNNRFHQAKAQIDQWADDRIKAAEIELDQIRRDLRAARRRVDHAETVQAQREATEEVTRLERERRRARRRIDDVEDEVEEQRRELLEQLEARCRQQQWRETLFTIRFEVR